MQELTDHELLHVTGGSGGAVDPFPFPFSQNTDYSVLGNSPLTLNISLVMPMQFTTTNVVNVNPYPGTGNFPGGIAVSNPSMQLNAQSGASGTASHTDGNSAMGIVPWQGGWNNGANHDFGAGMGQTSTGMSTATGAPMGMAPSSTSGMGASTTPGSTTSPASTGTAPTTPTQSSN